MTRGQIAIITGDDMVRTSTEFNGDMYVEGHGLEVIKRLRRVNDLETYEKEVKEFNKENFEYSDTPLTFQHNGNNMLDMSEETYFDKWFSDYVYIKNLTDTTHTIKDYKGGNFTIAPNQIAVICFGELEMLVAK